MMSLLLHLLLPDKHWRDSSFSWKRSYKLGGRWHQHSVTGFWYMFLRVCWITCLACLCTLSVLRTYVPSCFYFLRFFPFYEPYVPSFFYLGYVPSFLTCLTCLPFFTSFTCLPFLRTLICLRALPAFTFLSVSNFWRALYAFIFFIKCETTHKQLQQVGMSKNEVE